MQCRHVNDDLLSFIEQVYHALLLGDGFVYLAQQRTYLLLQFCTVLHHRLLPDESVPVRLGLYLCAVDVLHLKADEAALGKDQHQLGEHVVNLILDAVAEAVDRDEVRLLVTRQPDVVDVALERLLDPAARVDVVHVGVDDHLEHHPRVVGTAATLPVQLPETLQIQAVDNAVDQTHWVVRRDVLVNPLRKKHQLVVYVRAKV